MIAINDKVKFKHWTDPFKRLFGASTLISCEQIGIVKSIDKDFAVVDFGLTRKRVKSLSCKLEDLEITEKFEEQKQGK
jgi:hypothetical protein